MKRVLQAHKQMGPTTIHGVIVMLSRKPPRHSQQAYVLLRNDARHYAATIISTESMQTYSIQMRIYRNGARKFATYHREGRLVVEQTSTKLKNLPYDFDLGFTGAGRIDLISELLTFYGLLMNAPGPNKDRKEFRAGISAATVTRGTFLGRPIYRMAWKEVGPFMDMELGIKSLLIDKETGYVLKANGEDQYHTPVSQTVTYSPMSKPFPLETFAFTPPPGAIVEKRGG